MEYVCRRLTVSDVSMALGMNQDFRPAIVEEKALTAFLADSNNLLFAAISDDRVIGFAYGYIHSRMNNGNRVLYIHEVGVADACQHQGVGFRMMRELFDLCRAEGIARGFLTAYQNNEGANALYRKLGGRYCPESQGNDTVYWFHII